MGDESSDQEVRRNVSEGRSEVGVLGEWMGQGVLHDDRGDS